MTYIQNVFSSNGYVDITWSLGPRL